MKFAWLLLACLLCVVAAEDKPSPFDRFINVPNIIRARPVKKQISSPQSRPAPRPPPRPAPRPAPRPPPRPAPRPVPRPPPRPTLRPPPGPSPIDKNRYHFSWEHVKTKYDWISAIDYCTKLGPGWEGISINSREEDQFVRESLIKDDVAYIWTGGFKNGEHWLWPRGVFDGFGWSHSGGLNKPQPDDRAGGENCLSVLNNFYGDGVNWHDVQCHHEKAVICEKNF